MGLRAVIRAKTRSRHAPGFSDASVLSVPECYLCLATPNLKWATDLTEFNLTGNKRDRSSYLRSGGQHATGSALADRVQRGSNRSLGPRRALQNATPWSDACAAWSQTKHEPRRQLLDNDIVESFVGALKAEYFYLAALKGID